MSGPPITPLIARLLLGPSLGHGRRVEEGLCDALWLITLQMYLLPREVSDTKVMSDLIYFGMGDWWLLIVSTAAMLSTLGLVFNIRGVRGSRVLRLLGLGFGSVIWIAYLDKTVSVGLVGAPFAAILVVLIKWTVSQAALAFADLPRPGAPGNLGR